MSGLTAEKVKQVIGQIDPITTQTQGWQRELDDIEPVQQIVANSAGCCLGLEVAVGRGDQADVGGLRPGLSHALILAILEKPQ